MSFHHVRALHGSALNTSNRSRNLLLYQVAAPPTPGRCSAVGGFGGVQSRVSCAAGGRVEPRVTYVPVRLPLPPAKRTGSIYEAQLELKNSYFGTAEAPRPATRS